MDKITSYDLEGVLLFSPSVFYVQSSLARDKPIAIRLKISPKINMAFWEDTTRGHSIEIEKYTITENKITITSSDGIEWKFVPLTLEIFNTIKNNLVPFEQEFQSDEEVVSYYSNANFY